MWCAEGIENISQVILIEALQLDFPSCLLDHFMSSNKKAATVLASFVVITVFDWAFCKKIRGSFLLLLHLIVFIVDMQTVTEDNASREDILRATE